MTELKKRKSEAVVRAVESFYAKAAESTEDRRAADKARALARKWGRRAKGGCRRDDGR